MINGTTARITSYTVLVSIVLLIGGMVFLASAGQDIPPELGMGLTALVGFIAGTRFTPPDYSVTKLSEHVEPRALRPDADVAIVTKDIKS